MLHSKPRCQEGARDLHFGPLYEHRRGGFDPKAYPPDLCFVETAIGERIKVLPVMNHAEEVICRGGRRDVHLPRLNEVVMI